MVIGKITFRRPASKAARQKVKAIWNVKIWISGRSISTGQTDRQTVRRAPSTQVPSLLPPHYSPPAKHLGNLEISNQTPNISSAHFVHNRYFYPSRLFHRQLLREKKYVSNVFFKKWRYSSKLFKWNVFETIPHFPPYYGVMLGKNIKFIKFIKTIKMKSIC